MASAQRHATVLTVSLVLASLAAARLAPARPQPQDFTPKDYLSDEEADKIRDALTPDERIKLYVAFAEDRLKKFDYELKRTVPEARESDTLNGLLNGYVGCIDDGADQIQVAQDKQMDIHNALKLMDTKEKEFLEILQKYEKGAPHLDDYRDTLEDAIDGTKDAISDAEAADKTALPAPVRRKQ
jgi:predicted ribosome quality control (RQC) complex YloA/Tae2 family protein